MELLTISGLILGFGLGIKLYIFYKKKQAESIRKAIDNSPIPAFFPEDESTTCSAKGDIHEWESFQTLEVSRGVSESKMVCMKCGVISGTGRQFSQKGLENIRRQKKVMEETKAFMEELEAFRESELDIMAKLAYDDLKLEAVYKAGYRAFMTIEDKVAEKVEVRKRKMFEDMLAKASNIPGIKKD